MKWEKLGIWVTGMSDRLRLSILLRLSFHYRAEERTVVVGGSHLF